jgi:hypothetical protein
MIPFFLDSNGKFILTKTLILLENDPEYSTLINCMELVELIDDYYWRDTYIAEDDLIKYTKRCNVNIIDRRNGTF